MKCKNCGNTFEGNFCNYCGQKSNVQRINAENLLYELSAGLFNLNKGFFYTMKKLTIAPGGAIREYLIGKRKYFFKPIGYFFVLTTLYILVTAFSPGNNTLVTDIINGFIQGFTKSVKFSENGVSSVNSLSVWISNNYAYLILLLIPVLSISSFFCFRKQEENYTEHIVINLYITAQQTIFYIVFTILAWGTKKEDLIGFAVLLSIGYRLYSYFGFFKKIKKISIVFRLVCYYCVTYILIGLLFSITLMGLNL